MIIKGTNVEIPDSLIFLGNLDLRKTGLTELPAGLTVSGNLYLRDNIITELPIGLTVGGGLYLNRTDITDLPEGLTVGEVIYSSINLIASEELQLTLIKNNKYNFAIFKDPTESAIRLHKMLWVI